MKATESPLRSVIILEPNIHSDDRGWFYESWNQQTLKDIGVTELFVQDNHALSRKGILRGLHWQTRTPQGKLVRCTRGVIFDVAVDLRLSSPTFGRWFGLTLDEYERRQLWIPPTFAHGYLVLSEIAEVQYKTTGAWDRGGERGLHWSDPKIGITWPSSEVPITTNPRDNSLPFLADVPVKDLFP